MNVQAVELGWAPAASTSSTSNLTRGLDLAAASGRARDEAPLHAPAARRAGTRRRTAASPDDLRGLPVVCCSLHSQLAPVCAGIGPEPASRSSSSRAARSPSLSRTLCGRSKRQGLLETRWRSGPCVDGDVACVTPASALAWCAERGSTSSSADRARIVGTATRLRARGLAAAAAARGHAALGGSPILVARISGADQRERHHGVSHHLRAVLASRRAGRGRLAGGGGSPDPDRRGRRGRASTAGRRPARACRFSTWGAGPPTIPGSSPRRSPPDGSRATLVDPV